MISKSIHAQTCFGAFVVSLIALTACAGQNSTNNAQPSVAPNTEEVVNSAVPSSAAIEVDGSSTVYPISDAIAREYRQADGSKTTINLKFSGTSAGFRRFCAGETDVSNASRPIVVAEIAACNQKGVRFIELPIAFDALTLVVNPQNTWAKDMTIEELKRVWQPAAQGKIKNWSQVRASYPNRPMPLFGAGKDSGTFDYFNEVTTGKPKESRSDYTASEDDDVLVEGIAKDVNALGYLPFSYYEKNLTRLKALAIDTSTGAVLPARETVEKAQYQPFSRPLFIYVNAKSAQDKAAVRSFVEFYLKHAARVATSVDYIPLPDEAYHIAQVQFQKGKVGTVFEGVPQPNVTISELLRRQAVFQLSSQK